MDGGASYPATATSSIRNGRPAPSHRAAFSGPVFRGCALRFAPCARHFSPSGLRTLTSSLAALPPLSSAWSPLCVRKAHLRCFLLHWAHRRLLQLLAAPSLSPSLGLLRPVSRTARGEAPSHWARASCAPLALSLGFFDSLSRPPTPRRAPVH